MILVIVVHYGQNLKILKRCVYSFLKNEKNIKFLIVNNNNSQLKKSNLIQDPRLSILNSGKNLGYGGGFNLVLDTKLFRDATSVLLVNNDTYISAPVLNLLENELKNQEIGIVGPVVEFIKNGVKMYDMGGYINGKIGYTYHKETKKIQGKRAILVDFLGVCLLIKKDLLKKIKGFDKDFFLYYEDVDFCLRGRRIGFKTVVVPTTVIFHELSKAVGKDSKLAVYNQTKSAVLYMKKHLGLRRILFLSYLILQSAKRFVNNPSTGIYAFKAIFEEI